jgi:[glutamine synthetase] adenylyltransferase / [glutamine synthetase]-adenylyl-L-tyrosine phosphorylase
LVWGCVMVRAGHETVKLVSAADDAAVASSPEPQQSDRHRKEAPLTVLARVAPHLAAAFTGYTGRLDHFDRRCGEAALTNFARCLDKAAAAADLDTFLCRTHDLYRDRKRFADAGVALGRLSVADAGRIYAALADVVVTAVLRACEQDFARQYGRVPGGRYAVVALGSHGGREAGATSDLDLVFVYEVDDPALPCAGAVPLSATQYYGRLAQHVFAALGSDFGHGPMFDVDVDLRPWGSKGPLATRLTSLVDYFATEALTFEAMALTRARVVAGEPDFVADVDAALRQAVVATTTLRDVRSDISFMRDVMQEDGACRRVWDIKDAAGGRMDIDFILQGLTLVNAPAFARKPINDSSRAIATLRRMKALTAADARLLSEALWLYGAVTQIQNVAVQSDARQMPAELAATLASAAGVDDVRALERELRRLQREVARVFATVYGRPRRRDWIHRAA